LRTDRGLTEFKASSKLTEFKASSKLTEFKVSLKEFQMSAACIYD
jgi:hypothetical protein